MACGGVLSKPGDVDFFKFSAKKGQVIDVRVFARQLGSPLDSQISFHRADGSGIAGNDDSGGPDSYLRVTIPDDGDYAVAISDQLGAGGVDYAYRIEVTPVTPQSHARPARAAAICRRGAAGAARQSPGDLVGSSESILAANSESILAASAVEVQLSAPVASTVETFPMAANRNVDVPVLFGCGRRDAPGPAWSISGWYQGWRSRLIEGGSARRTAYGPRDRTRSRFLQSTRGDDAVAS